MNHINRHYGDIDMKRYASLVLTVLIAVLALFSAGCDRLGNLKEKETQKLYDEFKELAESGDLSLDCGTRPASETLWHLLLHHLSSF